MIIDCTNEYDLIDDYINEELSYLNSRDWEFNGYVVEINYYNGKTESNATKVVTPWEVLAWLYGKIKEK